MHMLVIACAALLAQLAPAPQPKPMDPIKAEYDRRDDALVRDGYNLTHGFSLKLLTKDAPIRLDFFVPAAGEDHDFSFWADTGDGSLAVEIVGPEKAIGSWSGRSGELALSLTAPAGRYQLRVDRISGSGGRALFGVKGAVLAKCELRDGELQEHASSPRHGFRFPYLLFLPKKLASHRLLVLPINTGFGTSDVELLRLSASCLIQQSSRLAQQLGAPVLVPLFPRPPQPHDDNLYVHALSRASLETKVTALQRVDLQLIAMIDDARAELLKQHLEVEQKILLFGFSAAASFASRFAMLHPERVAAVASGSPGGWPIAPLSNIEGDRLNYPVGIADLHELLGAEPDAAARKRVAWLFLLGSEDANDSVTYRDSFSKADEELIFKRFGKTPVERWAAAEKLYAGVGLDAKFALYPGEGHSMSAKMDSEVAAFFAAAK